MAVRVTVGHLQRDGRRYITEEFSDAVGVYFENTYLAPDGQDHLATSQSKEADLIRQFSNSEALQDVEGKSRPTARFQSIDEELLKVRERYLKSTGMETCRIARWVVDRLNDGSVTVVQMRTAFSVSPAQWNSINGRMDTFANSLTSVEGAVGE